MSKIHFNRVEPLDVRAREFARVAHGDQTYNGGPFFELHLCRVVSTLRELGETSELLLAAAWLHDVVEDTPTTIEGVAEEFGPELADLVHRLTDAPGETRRERQRATHEKIRGDVGAVRVKLADRIANVEAAASVNDPRLDRMYRKEYAMFREQLYVPLEYEAMWARLDSVMLFC